MQKFEFDKSYYNNRSPSNQQNSSELMESSQRERPLLNNQYQHMQGAQNGNTYDDNFQVNRQKRQTNQSSTTGALDWMPNKNVENCQRGSCLKKFGLFVRKHHCRICEQIFCSKCTTYKMQPLNKQFQKIRICLDCNNQMSELDRLKDAQHLYIKGPDYYENSIGGSSNGTMPKTRVNDQFHHSSTLRVPGQQLQAEGLQENQEDNKSNSEGEQPDDVPQDFQSKLKQVKQQSGVQAAIQLFNEQSQKMKSQLRQRQEDDDEESRTFSRSVTRKSRKSMSKSSAGNRGSGEFGGAGSKPEASELEEIRETFLGKESDEDSQQFDMDDKMEVALYEYLADIRTRVMREFDLDEAKWSDILSEFVTKAINTVRPWSFKCNDSIDITKYVKIQLIEYKDTSKCKYVNGVVMKKSIAHTRMKKEIINPRILLLSNSLGIQKDEEDFLDIENEIKQEDSFINIIMRKIEKVKPDVIIVQNDASFKAIEALRDMNITLVTNVKESVMQRLGRLTQTINCPSAVFLDESFSVGTCGKFFQEKLSSGIRERGKIENITHLIQLEDCLPFLGCTIILSDHEMNQLKIVKHALKKMLRLSRQIILENEYFKFLNLHITPGLDIDRTTPFLHQKHMERDFLIFKEVSFFDPKGRNLFNHVDDDDGEEDPEGNKIETNHAANQTEKEVQSRIQIVCQSPQMKRVHFYSEEHNDVSLVCKLREFSKMSITKCAKCQQYHLYHVYNFYHKNGYVQMNMRFSKAVDQSPEAPTTMYHMKQADDKPIKISCQCETCKDGVFPEEPLTKQLQEISFYSFLEQFFYNNDTVKIAIDESTLKTCNHPFHSHCKLVFMIDILRIEFQYHPVNIYELDLLCYKNMQGTLNDQQLLENFINHKIKLQNEMHEAFQFILKSSQDLNTWLNSILNLDILQNISNNFNYSQAKNILENCCKYLENLDKNVIHYKQMASECLQSFRAENEFYLNKIHKSIASRVSDYIYILKVIYSQIFDEFIHNIGMNKGNSRDSKKKSSLLQVQHLSQTVEKQMMEKRRATQQQQKSDPISKGQNPNLTQIKEDIQFTDNDDTLERTKTPISEQLNDTRISNIAVNQNPNDSMLNTTFNNTMIGNTTFTNINEEVEKDKQRSNSSSNLNTNNEKGDLNSVNIQDLVNFENNLKENQFIKSFMAMSPSIQNGFDMNCTTVDDKDYSAIITQALLSNEHLMGLKEQGYMNLNSRFEKYKHLLRKSDGGSAMRPKEPVEASPQKIKEPIPQVIQEEFLVFKDDQDILNKEISQKELETELLRVDQYNFLINLNTYKGPNSNEMFMTKERETKKVKVDRKILQKTSTLECLEKISPEDLDISFYNDLNQNIVYEIFKFKNTREIKANQNENQCKQISQQEKYSVHALFYPKVDITVKILFPSHFQALRKLYCGSFNALNEGMFISQPWDTSGGKSASKFYKSQNGKYVMKVINSREMAMFTEFAQPYFEYMCRSFNQKCPTAICKTLGAFQLDIKRGKDKPIHEYVILMENLNLGMDGKSPNIAKYDLKGSMLRRYVVTKDKTVTKLDTNFIEDNNSKPICMNYTLHRLMEIAIHNDTNFLSRYEKIDYSFLVWIDHENLLVRVGIIDYIQYYSFAKMLEHQVKKTLAGKAPTILDPFAYKQRFKQHMNNYIMSILGDQPIESFSEISRRQMEKKERKQLQVLHKTSIKANQVGALFKQEGSDPEPALSPDLSNKNSK